MLCARPLRALLPHGCAAPLLVLVSAISAGTALAAPRIPARFLPGDAAVAPAANNQDAPFLAAGGGGVLAVWSDNRANSTGGYEGETSQDIYGMRLDGAGQPLDQVPFPVAAGRAAQTLPRAAWNGTHWLVVYESVDMSGTGYYYESSLEAVRVAPDGRVVDPKPIRLFNLTPVGGTWAVASDGSGWVVVNQGTSASDDMVGVRVSAGGVLLDRQPRSLVNGTYYLRGRTHLEHAAGVFLLAYEESMSGSDPTSAIRFDGALNLLDPAPYDLVGSTVRRLASNGTGFYTVWEEQLPDWTMAVKGSRIGTGGRLLDGTGVNISGPNPPQSYTTTSVAWDGTNWKVTWGGPGGTRVARVSASGQVLDPGGVLVAGIATGLTASAGNGSVQLAWSAYGGTNNDVLSGNISASNVAGPTRTLSLGAPSQVRHDAAASGSGYMVVFRSSTATRTRILAEPLDAAGNPGTAEPVELASADGTNEPNHPAVAWNGSVYLAAWSTGSSIVTRRIRPDGAIIDPAPITVLSSAFGPLDVEALGGDFLVAGLRCGINCQYIFPIAARVRGSDGAVLDPSPIQMGGTYSTTPVLAELGGRWLLVWRANWSHDECGASTLGTFIDAAGNKTPDFTVHGPYSSCGGNGIFGIGLAASGNVALMVQSQELTSGVETDLLFRLVNPDGTVQPYVNMTPWEEDQYRPRVTWDGSHFVVVWQDQRAALSGVRDGWTLEQIDARSDLMGMRITEAGAIVDPQGFVLSNSAAAETHPSVVAAGGVTLFTAALVRHGTPLANYRIGYELLGTGGNAWPSPRAAAAPRGGEVPVSVAFDSAGTFDPDGAVASYLWDFGDGATSAEANPVHVYEAPGPYVPTVTVTDDRGASALQQVLVNAVAGNKVPVAVASSNRNGGPSPLDVTFYADGSYDPDGFLGNIKWTFSDGGEYWGATAYHTFYQSGTHQVTLTVYDAWDATGTATLSVTVDPPLAPAAPADLVATAFDPQWINLMWTDNSNSEDGFSVERCQGSGAFCAGSPASWAEIARVGANIDYYGDTGLPASTTFSYRVRAFNVSGVSPYSNTATATTPTWPPVALIVPSVLNGAAPLAVTFDGSGSDDPDGTIVSYSWDFGDGTTGTGAVVTHTYTSPGWYNAALTVADNGGATDTEYSDGIHVTEGNERSPASGDAGTNPGAIQSGSYLDTRTQNDVAEVLAETLSSGTPSTRRSQLQHTWSLAVAAGSMQAFYLNAWHTPNGEGDDFVFEYSRDNVTWTAMLTLRKTADDDTLESYAFPTEATGQLWVRVRDLDRTPGRGQVDRVFVDEMFVSSSPSTGRSGEVSPAGATEAGPPLTVRKSPYGELVLSWAPSCVATDTDFGVYEGTLGSFRSHVPVRCSTGGATTATIPAPQHDAYFLVVPNDRFYEGRYGTASSGAEILAGPTRCWQPALTTGCP